MPFCLLEPQSDKFKKALKDGAINPDKMIEMTSEERREFLSEFVGKENAKEVNILFESKLLLKNQKRGMITWATKVGNLTPESRKNIIDKIEKLDKALSPIEENLFLADIVEKRLGVQVDENEAAIITGLAEQMNSEWDNAAKKAGADASIKEVKAVLREDPNKTYFRINKELNDFMAKQVPGKLVEGWFDRGSHILNEGLSVARALKTGLDLSAVLRQGITYFGRREWNGAFIRMFGYAKTQSATDQLEVNMLSHKYSDEAMAVKRDLGLTLLGESFTQREEQFASKLIEGIPLLRGSERAHTGFLNDLRFNRFVNVLQKLDEAGNGITDNPKAMKDLAKVISAATGRGTLGSAEGAARPLATVLFSPRWFASRIQLVTNVGTKSGPARIEAAKALGTMVGLTTTIMGLALMAGLDPELDPRSSDFGKVKIKGKIRFDATFGMGSYVRVIVQIALRSTKSSTTGRILALNSGDFGGRTGFDVLTSFIENKASPAAGIIRDALKGEGFAGAELTPAYIANQLLTPLILDTTIEAYQQSGGSLLTTGAVFAAEMFGIGVNSYGYVPGGNDWEELRETDGKKYEEAVLELNKSLMPALKDVHNSDKFQGFTVDEQNATINAVIAKEKEKIERKFKIGTRKERKERKPSGERLLRSL